MPHKWKKNPPPVLRGVPEWEHCEETRAHFHQKNQRKTIFLALCLLLPSSQFPHQNSLISPLPPVFTVSGLPLCLRHDLSLTPNSPPPSFQVLPCSTLLKFLFSSFSFFFLPTAIVSHPLCQHYLSPLWPIHKWHSGTRASRHHKLIFHTVHRSNCYSGWWCMKDREGVKKNKKKQPQTETPQGQSDTGRNPSPLLVPEPPQKHNTKALFPSKIKLPADWSLLQDLPKYHHMRESWQKGLIKNMQLRYFYFF